MSTSTITSKGQITLPKEVRERLHLSLGDRVEFVVGENGVVQVRPLTGPVRALFGLVHRSETRSPTLEELEQALLDSVGQDNERIRKGLD